MIESEPLKDLLVILSIISSEGSSFRGKTRLHKLAFLSQKESKDKFDLEFEAAPLGPLSPKLNHLLERMKKLKLLKETVGQTPLGYDVMSYSLTASGTRFLNIELESGELSADIQKSINNVFSKYGKWSYGKLLDYVHKEYPAYQIKM